MRHEQLTEKIIRCAYRVYNRMGYGFLESVYEKCLVLNFGERRVEVKRKVKDLSQG